jgi:hypothetical protein
VGMIRHTPSIDISIPESQNFSLLYDSNSKKEF